ncbi:DedA family protein [Candidatus Saccharibacteria bacterium]|nr:DedA family protein [Candidatus Saccharibacteria bacterium]
MLPGVELTELIRAVGIFGLMAIVFAESGILLGFFLPGDTLLFTAGFLAHQGVLGVSVEMLAGLLFLSAVVGDSVGYAFGKRVGPRIFRKEDSLFFHREYIERAEKFYEKYGAITIVLARFVPVVRTFAPVVAGVGRMNYSRFLAFNVIGGLLWAVGLVYLGYYAGEFFESRGIEIDHFILPIIGLAMLITVASPLTHLLSNKKSRAQLTSKLKRRR